MGFDGPNKCETLMGFDGPKHLGSNHFDARLIVESFVVAMAASALVALCSRARLRRPAGACSGGLGVARRLALPARSARPGLGGANRRLGGGCSLRVPWRVKCCASQRMRAI